MQGIIAIQEVEACVVRAAEALNRAVKMIGSLITTQFEDLSILLSYIKSCC